MTRLVRIAIAQYGIEPGTAADARSAAEDAIRRAVQHDANIVVLPELAVPGYTSDPDVLRASAEPLDGPTVREWSALAADSGTVIVGGFCESAPEGLYNTAVTVGPMGVVSAYRKLHLFAAEKDLFVRGNLGLPLVATPFGLLGSCVCYDLRFPEVVRSLALRGAEIIAVPTAWVCGFDQQRWDAEGMCPQAVSAAVQANLSQVVIACASAVGQHGGHELLGSSVVIGPRGQRLVGPLPGATDAHAWTDIDLDQIADAQSRGINVDPRNDRRTDVYGVYYDGELL